MGSYFIAAVPQLAEVTFSPLRRQGEEKVSQDHGGLSEMMDEKEQINELLDEIKQKNLLVIVEGKKDVSALKSLGIENVISLKKPLFAVVEDVAMIAEEVVLLTDLDEEGKKLYHELSVNLQKFGVKINNHLREFLFKTQLRQIEGLATYLA